MVNIEVEDDKTHTVYKVWPCSKKKVQVRNEQFTVMGFQYMPAVYCPRCGRYLMLSRDEHEVLYYSHPFMDGCARSDKKYEVPIFNLREMKEEVIRHGASILNLCEMQEEAQ